MTPDMTDGTKCLKTLIKQQNDKLDADGRFVALLLFHRAMVHSCVRTK
jgi:hypothetical protein